MFNEQPPQFTEEIKSRKGLKIFTAILSGIIIAGLAFLFWPSNISRDEASQTAISHVGGGVANRPERDFEAFTRVWSVEVFHDNLVHEVFVSMRTGEVVRVEIDRWD
ncbi:MAG: PepSY domain-containing protein [Defluviitaleaceae bacterium]|nr:PepSY domain-containing protein [Defluviitaleaceae bacterium]